jgi:hypothetical protein
MRTSNHKPPVARLEAAISQTPFALKKQQPFPVANTTIVITRCAPTSLTTWLSRTPGPRNADPEGRFYGYMRRTQDQSELAVGKAEVVTPE